MVESSCLENSQARKGLEGSNPSLSVLLHLKILLRYIWMLRRTWFLRGEEEQYSVKRLNGARPLAERSFDA